MRLTSFLIIAALCTACLERSDTEMVGYSSFIVPRGGEVRLLERTMAAKMKLDLNDGLSSPVPLRTGFAKGEEVQYWDLGQAPTNAEPMWIFVMGSGEGAQAVREHPPLIESIPGDSNYSPVRLLFQVSVTPLWSGEKFPSLRALEDGIELGLLEEPVALNLFTNCVVTLEGTEFETGPDSPPLRPTPAYYRGRTVFQFCVGDVIDGSGTFVARNNSPVFGNAYLLRRENEGPSLDENLFKMDLNEDGDDRDSNVVFDSVPQDTTYTSLWKSFEVVTTPDYMFGEIQGAEMLFEKQPWGLEPISDQIVEYKDTATILNRPHYRGTP